MNPGGFTSGEGGRSAGNMKRKLAKVLVCMAIVALTALWLKELTQRLARDRADAFMGPLLTVYTCTHMRLAPWFVDARDGRLHGPTWLLSYDSDLFLVDWPPVIGVSPFRAVTIAWNAGDTNSMVNLSDDTRRQNQWLWVKGFHDDRAKKTEPNKPPQGNSQ